MEITRDKLPESTKLILDSIDQADFIAVDCEFSGMRISKSKIPQSPDQRYTETKAAAECFAVIQMGLCPTRWNHELQQYEASPYNFFISPTLFSQFNENVLCRKIEFEAAAIEFLLQHNFDFSKLFRQGVFYLNEQEEGKLREDFLRKREIIQADRQGYEFLHKAFKEIYTWKHDTSEWKLPFVNVDTPNGFFRRLLCQELEINAEFTFETRPGFIQVTSKGNEAVENDRKLRMIGGFEGKIDKAKGLRTILDYLSKSRKPLVGHNVFGDIMRIYCSLMKGSLPSTLAEFCKAILETFPIILDTKFLAHKENVLGDNSKGTSLQDIVTWSNDLDREGLSFTCHPEFLQYSCFQRDHEAGYDALMTAKIFVRLSSRIPALTLPHSELPGHRDIPEIQFQCDESQQTNSFASKSLANPIRPFGDPIWGNYSNMLSLNGTTGIGILDICKRASSVQRKSKGHVDAEEFIARRFLLARPINASVLSQRDTLRNKGLEIYALNGSRQTSRNDKDCKGKWPNRGRALWKLPPLNVHHSYASNHTNPLPPIQAYQHLNLPRHQTGLRQLASRQVPGRMVVPRPRSSHPPLHPVYRPPNAGM